MKALFSKTKLVRGWRLAIGLFSLGLTSVLITYPVKAAEEITLSYGFMQYSVSINALESYAKTGEVTATLLPYIHQIPPDQFAPLRQLLLTPIPLDAQQVAQLLQTPLGQKLVNRLSRLIQPGQSQSSQLNPSVIQAAFVRAATNPDGFTLLDVLHQFPDAQIKVDISQALRVITAAKTLVKQTNDAIVQVKSQAQKEASAQPLPDVPLAELHQSGYFNWEQQTLTLTDQERNRTVPVDLYLPLVQRPHPVIVISHGLSSDRSSFAYLAKHLASHGFAVVVPEHPGSSWQQLLALFDHKSDRINHPQEFADRSLDISYILDELGTLAQSHPDLYKRLNLKQVGVMGQSFGGYTALTLAGADSQFERLKMACQQEQTSLNLSLMLQCQALALSQENYELSDPRVHAVMAISPIGSGLLGQASMSQINVPTLIVASSADALAPAVVEQIQPFSWLTASRKYLALIHGGTHFSSVGSSVGQTSESLSSLWGTDTAIVHDYITTLSTAFFQTHLANHSGHRPYLTAAYAKTISQDTLPLSLVQSFTYLPLNQASSGFNLSNPLIIIGISTQVIGLLYYIAHHRSKLQD
ncbi:MAG: alpha/beta hydrolase [Elainellaceae cyanobacterium]